MIHAENHIVIDEDEEGPFCAALEGNESVRVMGLALPPLGQMLIDRNIRYHKVRTRDPMGFVVNPHCVGFAGVEAAALVVCPHAGCGAEGCCESLYNCTGRCRPISSCRF